MFLGWVKSFTEAEIGRDYPLKGYTTIGTGGTGEYFVMPKSARDLKDLLFACDSFSVKPIFLGCGSNILFSDKKIKGAVISTLLLKTIKSDGEFITAYAGAKLCDLTAFLQKKGFGGYAGLCGIPSSVGGAVVMNAGAFGYNISDYIIGVTVVDKSGERFYNKSDCRFSYRKSAFSSREFIKSKSAVISATFRFPPAAGNECEKIKYYKKARANSQPQGKTFGSVFKNGKDFKAGELLDGAGLKGYKIGGAGFSEKHANFIINYCDATSSDIYALIKTAKDKVFKKYGVKLKEEVRFTGDF